MNSDEKQRIISNSVYAMMRVHDAMLNWFQAEQSNIPESFTEAMKKTMDVMWPVYSKSDILSMKQPFFDQVMHEAYSQILDRYLAAYSEGFSANELQGFMNETMEFMLILYYSEFAQVAIMRIPRAITSRMIDEWVTSCIEQNAYDEGLKIIGTIIGSKNQISLNDLERWLELFAPETALEDPQRAPQWDYYGALAVKILESCTPAGRVAFAATCPGVAGSFNGQHIDHWIVVLKGTGRMDLAAKVEMAALAKGYVNITVPTIMDSIQTASSANHEAGVQLHAYALRNMPQDAITKEQVHQWINDATGYEKSINAGAIAVAAIERGLANKDEIIQWVDGFYHGGLQEQGVAIARAALTKEGGIPDLLSIDVVAWLKFCSPGHGCQILCTLLETDLGGDVSMDTIQAQSKAYAAGGRVDLLRALAVAALRSRNERALHQIYLAMAEYYQFNEKTTSDIQGLAAIFFKRLSFIEDGVQFVSATADMNTVAGISNKDILNWGQRCLEANRPEFAVEIGIAAQDAGIDVSAEKLQNWQAACYDDKPADEALNNAIALMKIYRNRPGVGKESDEEIRTAYGKVMERRESMGLTVSLPYREAMEKIDAILFAGVRANSS